MAVGVDVPDDRLGSPEGLAGLEVPRDKGAIWLGLACSWGGHVLGVATLFPRC